MARFASFALIGFALAFVVFLVFFSTGTAGDLQPFTPLSIEDNKETDTSPEEITEMMVPVCKLFFDAYPPCKDISGAFSPDNRYFAVSNATGSFGVSTALFDLQTAKNLKHFQGSFFSNGIAPVAFSPDSKKFAFLCGIYVVVWDILEDKEVCRIPLSNDPAVNYIQTKVYSLRFSDDNKHLWGVVGNTGIIWNIEAQGAVVKTFSRDTSVQDPFRSLFHCYPDLSRALFSERETGKHWLCNLTTNKDLEWVSNSCVLDSWTIREHLSKMVFSGDYRLFALNSISSSANKDHLIVWDAIMGTDICTIPVSYKWTAAVFLPGTHILVTACDTNPSIHIPFEQRDNEYPPLKLPMRKPIAKTETRAILEFWDIDNLIWYKEKVNLFPRKIKTAYLEGDDDIQYMVASQDGKLLYMRSGKPALDSKHVLSLANGYIFSLDPDHKPDLPAEIQLDDGVIVNLSVKWREENEK